jgi:hypothetical protein
MKQQHLVLFIILLGFVSCSVNKQDEVLIEQFSIVQNSHKKIKEILFKKGVKFFEKNYAYNGWQIIDSIAFEKDNLRSSIFEPIYNESTQKLTKYIKIKDFPNKPSKYKIFFMNRLKDKYSLTSYYTDVLAVILDLMQFNLKVSDLSLKYAIKTNFIPSILTNYGIPTDELLDSCSYLIAKEGFLKEDNFYFSHYTVHRTYYYNDSILQCVNIKIIDNPKKRISEIKENFLINQNSR